MNSAVGYTRLSQDGGRSISRQKRRIREYAEEHGLGVIRIYDDGQRSSGYETSREEYQQLLDDASAGEFEAVIVDDGSRLGRETKERVRAFYDLDDFDVEFHAAQYGHVDPDEPMEVLMEVFRAATDEEAKRAEIEKAQEAVSHRIDQGCYQGRPPFGLKFAEDKCHLEKDSEQWEICTSIWDEGVDAQDVAESTAYRIEDRGREWYESKLAEYGTESSEAV